MNENEFFKACESKYCPRQMKKVKNCIRQTRQEGCYKKYVNGIEKHRVKQEKKINEEKVKREFQRKANKEVMIRDKTCLVVKILTKKELEMLLEKHDKSIFSGRVDCAHILEKSKYPDIKYDTNNIFLCSRFFHDRLDNYLDLVTGGFIGSSGRAKWIERIMKENGLWNNDYTYEKFKEEKGVDTRNN